VRSPYPLVGAASLFVGCVSTNAAVLDPTVKYQKICSDGVQIFTSAQRVTSSYREVALLPSRGESDWTDERMTGSQRKKAAELGANGIIVGEIKEPNPKTEIIGSILGTGAERKAGTLAIYVFGDSGRVRQACGTGPRYPVAANTKPRADERVPSSPAPGSGMVPMVVAAPEEPWTDSMAIYRSLVAPPVIDEAVLGRNPELRRAMADTRRVGIATAFFEEVPGTLKIELAEGFRSVQAKGFTLGILWEAYRGHRPFDEPIMLELWEGDSKVGEYTVDGLALRPE
jgi:hypothetical protein